MNEDHNELNDRLLKLVTAAQQPDCSQKERSRLLGMMIQQAQPHLSRPHQARFPYRYEEIYEEACQNLFTFVSQNIHQYQPEKASVLGWLNFLLRQRFIYECSRDIIGRFPTQPGEVQLACPESETASLAELTRKCLEEDVDGSFRQAHIENRPDVSFQVIMLWRLDNRKWGAISAETGVPVPTLSSFHKRQLKKLKLKIQTYVQDNSHLSRRDLNL